MKIKSRIDVIYKVLYLFTGEPFINQSQLSPLLKPYFYIAQKQLVI